MEFIICPACSKKIKNLKLHYRASHPDLDVPDMRNPGPAPEPEKPQEQAKPSPQEPPIAQPRQESVAETPSDFLQKLKAFGINPNDVMAALGPLVETSVVQTLEKMQLGENINKKMADVETRLGEKIQPLVDMGQQLQSGRGVQPSGNGQPGEQPGNTALRDQALVMLMQKFLNPNSGGGLNLENLVKQQTSLYQLIEAVTKPQREAEDAMLRRITAIINIGSKAGKTPSESLGAYGSV